MVGVCGAAYVFSRLLFFFLMIRRPPRSTLFPSTLFRPPQTHGPLDPDDLRGAAPADRRGPGQRDRKSTRLNSSHVEISYAVFCLKKKKKNKKVVLGKKKKKKKKKTKIMKHER